MSKKADRKQTRRSQADLAKAVGLAHRSPITLYLRHGRGASPQVADRLARETETDIRLWLAGGDCADRQTAVARWKQNF